MTLPLTMLTNLDTALLKLYYVPDRGWPKFCYIHLLFSMQGTRNKILYQYQVFNYSKDSYRICDSM